MKKVCCLLLAALFVFSAACAKQNKEEAPPEEISREEIPAEEISREEIPAEEISPEEIGQLEEAHPQFFGLDTTEGLNVLVYGGGKAGDWAVRLVPGSKDHYGLKESIEATTYLPLTLDEAKALLIYYGLPDEQVILRPYDDPIASSFTLSMLMEDESYLTQMAEAFDNRYSVGEIFEVVYDSETDKLP